MQNNGNTILSNGIQPHDQSPWFKPVANYSSKTQFSLALFKSPIFIGNIKSPVPTSNIKNSIFIGNIKNPVPTGNIQSPFFIGTILSKSPRLLMLGKENISWYNHFSNIAMAIVL